MHAEEAGLSAQEYLAARFLLVDDYLVRPGHVSWVQLPSGEKVVLVGRSYREQDESLKTLLMEAGE